MAASILSIPPQVPMASPLLALESMWDCADAFFDALPDSTLLARPITLRNPFLFYLGHLPSFAWITARRMLKLPAMHPTFDELFSRGIDPDTDDPSLCHSHPAPPPTWPPHEQVIAYRDTVRSALRTACKSPDIIYARLLRILAEHDAMHLETLQYMLVQTYAPRPCCAEAALQQVSWDAPTPTYKWVSVPAGTVSIGAPNAPFAWDNELSAKKAQVPAFSIAQTAVSIGQFIAFVRAGGYDQRSLWTADDWLWVKRENRQHPSSWCCDDKGGFRVLTGMRPPSSSQEVSREVFMAWPASVSLAEARAYAAWCGCKLPSEEQWLLAAYGEDGARACVEGSDFVTLGAPHSVRNGAVTASGAIGMVGNGWELTETPFDTFEGFKPMVEYPEYSADFFDGKHYVLKGASWATPSLLVRPSFRNFYQARYPYVFSKFRLVKG